MPSVQRLFIAGLLLALPAAAGGLSIQGFKNDLVEYLLKQISVPGQFEVRAERIEEAKTGQVVLSQVRIADARGDWFKARQFAFTWSPSRLLSGEVHIERLALDGGRLARLPEVPAPDGDKQAAVGKDAAAAGTLWPRSPITLRLDALEIRDMQVSEQVTPQALTFDAQGSVVDEGEEQSLQLKVQRRDAVQGTIDIAYRKRFDTDVLDLSVAASEGVAGLVAALVGLPPDVPVALQLQARGPPANFTGSMDLSATGMLAARGAVSAAWAERLRADLDLNLTTGAALPASARAAIGDTAGLRLEVVEGDDGLVTIKRGQLAGAAITVAARGTFDRVGRVADLALDVDVDANGAERLQALMAPARFAGGSFRLQVSGPVAELNARGQGQVQALEALGFAARRAELDFVVSPQAAGGQRITLDLVAREPRGPSADYAQALGNELRVRLRAGVDATRVALETASIDAGALSASASGQILLAAAGPRLDLRYLAAIPDLLPVAAVASLPLAGSARATGTLAGVAGDLRHNGELSVRQAVFEGRAIGDLELSHTSTMGTRTQGEARLALRSALLGDGRASARYVLEADGLSVDALDADLLGMRARGRLRLPIGATLPVANLALDVRSLAPAGALLGLDLAGSGSGEADLSARGVATATLSLDALSVDDVSLALVRLTTSATGLQTQAPVVELALTGQGLGPRTADRAGAGGNGARWLDSVELRINGPTRALRLAARGARAEAAPGAGFPVELELDALADLSHATERVLDLERALLKLGAHSASLAAPVRIRTAADKVSVSPFVLVLPDAGRVEGELALAGASLKAELRLLAVPLRLAGVYGLAPVAAGTLEGSVALATGSAAAGEAHLEVNGLKLVDAPADTASLRTVVDAGWDGRLLRANATVSGPFEMPAEAALELPLVAPAAGPPVIPKGGELKASVAWRGNVEPLFALLPAPDHLLSGALALDMRAAGPLDALNVSGELGLSDGRYENLASGTIVQGITLTTRFPDARTLEVTLTGSDGVEGSVDVRGRIDDLGAAARIDLLAKVERFLAVRLDAAVARADANLKLSGTPTDLAITGRVGVERAEIRLIDATPPSVVEIPNVEVVGASRPKRAVQPEPEQPGRVALDIEIDVPGPVFVNGRGLSSEWFGAFRVAGTAAKPEVAGRLESRRGRFDFVGRPFRLSKGLVAFDGARDLDPRLDVRLEREANGITGRILVAGLASSPDISFESTPPAPEDEVLARVLFGRSTQSLSPGEALQLAAALNSLVSGKADIVDGARTSLGLDVLRLEAAPGDDGGSSVSVGRYVSDGVYVGARQGFDGKPGSVVVEIDILENVVIDADVGQEANTGVGVSWRKDF